jgi:signal recognition particle GTPase
MQETQNEEVIANGTVDEQRTIQEMIDKGFISEDKINKFVDAINTAIADAGVNLYEIIVAADILHDAAVDKVAEIAKQEG